MTLAQPRSISAALVIPALLGAVVTVGVQAWRVVAPAQAEVGHRVHASLAEAIALDDVRGAYDFIRRGQDPNEPIPVRDQRLTGDREILVAPVVWATAAGRRTIVLMLLQAGATLVRDADKAAPCIAERLGYSEIASDLRRLGGLSATTCPPVPAGAPLGVGADAPSQAR